MTYSGWWYTYPSEKYEFASWDYEFPKSINRDMVTPFSLLDLNHLNHLNYLNHKSSLFLLADFDDQNGDVTNKNLWDLKEFIFF